jgi:membrane-associated protease RseP (regulator of RpoE activity)
MSDESPRDESPANDAPTEQSAAAADEAAPAGEATPAADESPAVPPPPGEPPARSGFFVPRWAAFVAGAVVAVLVLFFGGFALGHYTAPSGDHEGRERTAQEGPGRRGGNESPGRPGGNGGARPTSGVFLGVAAGDAANQGGAEILNVAGGSPAEQAGLQAGDVITDVDGSAIKSASDLRQQVRSRQPGDQVTITYSRGGNSAQAQVTLGSRSPAATPSA